MCDGVSWAEAFIQRCLLPAGVCCCRPTRWVPPRRPFVVPTPRKSGSIRAECHAVSGVFGARPGEVWGGMVPLCELAPWGGVSARERSRLGTGGAPAWGARAPWPGRVALSGAPPGGCRALFPGGRRGPDGGRRAPRADLPPGGCRSRPPTLDYRRSSAPSEAFGHRAGGEGGPARSPGSGAAPDQCYTREKSRAKFATARIFTHASAIRPSVQESRFPPGLEPRIHARRPLPLPWGGRKFASSPDPRIAKGQKTRRQQKNVQKRTIPTCTLKRHRA